MSISQIFTSSELSTEIKLRVIAAKNERIAAIKGTVTMEDIERALELAILSIKEAAHIL